MKVAAFIPARGGSKRIPGKNLAIIGTRSLLRRAIDGARGCASVTVSSDEGGILACAELDGALRHERPAALASDHAQIEDAIAHWWRRLDVKPDAVVVLQPTSPFRTGAHVAEALSILETTGVDCVVGVTAGHAPHFAGRMKPREFGRGEWLEWQPFRSPVEPRPRTQDLTPMGVENGALYAFTRAHWERTANRMGGAMAALPMSWIDGLDIDTREDLQAARALAEWDGL